MIGEQPGDKEDLAGHPFVARPASCSIGHSQRPASTARRVRHGRGEALQVEASGNGKVRLHQKPIARRCVRAPLVGRRSSRPCSPLVVLLGATAARRCRTESGASPRPRCGDSATSTSRTPRSSPSTRRRCCGCGPRARRSLRRSRPRPADRSGARGVPGRVRIGCSGWVYRGLARHRVPRGAPAARVVRSLRRRFDTVEINNTFYRLPTDDRGRALGRAGPAGLRVRGEARVVRLAPHEAARRGAWLPNHLDRVRRLGRALGPTSCSSHPAGSATSGDSTSSSTSRRATCAGPSSSGIPSWLHDDVYASWTATARRCASTTCSPTTRGS